MLLWFNHRPARARSRLTGFLFSLILVTTISGSLLAPRPAQGQAAAADIIGGPSNVASYIWDRIQDAATWAWERGAAIAFKNAAKTFTQRIAYDTAVMLASGGQGQTPLLSWRSLGQTTQRAFDDAAGDFLETLDTNNAFISLGICRPPGTSFQLIVTTTLFNEIRPRQPVCSLSQIEQNWKTFFADTDQLLKRFGVVFDPSQNDLGVALRLQQSLIQDARIESDLAKLTDIMNLGFKDVEEPITGNIKTRAERIIAHAEITQAQAVASEFSEFTGDSVADALGIFTNTLAARLMKRLLQGDIPNPSRLDSGRFGLGISPCIKRFINLAA